jgi:transcriptional repressor NrdR
VEKVIKVKKKNGSEETFDPEKFRRAMLKAAIDAGYTLEGNVDLTLVDIITDDLEKELQGENEVDSATIREKILNKLEEFESSIAQSWRNFEKKYKS